MPSVFISTELQWTVLCQQNSKPSPGKTLYLGMVWYYYQQMYSVPVEIVVKQVSVYNRR